MCWINYGRKSVRTLSFSPWGLKRFWDMSSSIWQMGIWSVLSGSWQGIDVDNQHYRYTKLSDAFHIRNKLYVFFIPVIVRFSLWHRRHNMICEIWFALPKVLKITWSMPGFRASTFVLWSISINFFQVHINTFIGYCRGVQHVPIKSYLEICSHWKSSMIRKASNSLSSQAQCKWCNHEGHGYTKTHKFTAKDNVAATISNIIQSYIE